MLNGMKTGAKILGGYMLMIVFLVLVAGIAIFSIQNLVRVVDTLVFRTWPKANTTLNLVRAIEETQGLMLKYWVIDTIEGRAGFRTVLETQTAEFDDLVEDFQGVAVDEEDKQYVEQIDKLRGRYLQAATEYMGALDSQTRARSQLDSKMEELNPYLDGLDGVGAMYELIDKQKAAFYRFHTYRQEEDIREIVDLDKRIRGFAEYTAIAREHGAFYDLAMEVIGLDQEYDRYTLAAAQKEEAMAQLKDELVSDLEKFESNMKKNFEEGGAGVMTTANTSRAAILVVSVLAALLGITVGIVVVRNITKPLTKFVEVAQKIAEGDLTLHVEAKSRDEIGDLARSFNQMTGQLNENMREIRERAEQVASSSEEISSSAQQLASGAQSQASTLEETSASVEEMTASVEQVADHAQSQAASVEETSASMKQVQTSVDQVSETLKQVSTTAKDSTEKTESGVESVKEAVEAIKRIAEGSEQISGIVNVISDIADQTNLLALNASIEAARAGEHGRGFAVVADEVSKLADRSSSSTKEIEKLIVESNKNVTMGVEVAEKALSSMEEIITGARTTTDMVNALAGDIEQQFSAIKEVAQSTESISEMSQSISAATEEQTTNAKQVSKAVENVNELTQQAASAAEEVAAGTEELSTVAQQMQQLVEQFRLSEDTGRQLPQPKAMRHGGAGRPGTAGKKHLFTPAGETDATAVALKKKRMNGDAA